ncbi:hypothetical protein PRJH_0744 [Providencia rustigianii]
MLLIFINSIPKRQFIFLYLSYYSFEINVLLKRSKHPLIIKNT